MPSRTRHFRRNPLPRLSVVGTSTHIARGNNGFPHRVCAILCAIVAAALIGTISSGTSLNPVDPLAVCFAPPFSFVLWACALPYCSGTIGASQHVAPNVISDNTGNGCTVAANMMLTLSGANLPVGAASAGSVAMRFASGTVQSQGIIVVQGPSSAAAPSKMPMVVLITDTTFLSGAAVKVTGSYPLYSNITIANNTFTSQEHCAPLGVLIYFVTVIAFIDTVPIVLSEGASISAQYNNINTNSGSTMHSIPFVVNSITFANSSVIIRGNLVKSHGKATGGHTWTIFFDVLPTVYVNGNTERATFRFLGGGVWVFEENTINITTANSETTQLANNPRIITPNGGIYNMRGNHVSVSLLPSQSENTILTFTSITNTFGFQFRMDDNIFLGHGRHSSVSMPDAVLSRGSLLSITNNIFTSNGASVALRLVINPVTATDDSFVRIGNNTFLSPQGAARAHAITLMNPFRLQDTASLSLSGNSVDAAVRSSTYKLIAASAANALSVSPTARVYVCGTRYNGEAVRSLLRFRVLAADATFGLIPIEYCPQTASASVTQSSSLARSRSYNGSASASVVNSPTIAITTGTSSLAVTRGTYTGSRSDSSTKTVALTTSHSFSARSGTASSSFSRNVSSRSGSATITAQHSVPTATNQKSKSITVALSAGSGSPTVSANRGRVVGSGTVSVQSTPTHSLRRLAPIPAPSVVEAARVIAAISGPPLVLGIIAGVGVGGQLGVANALARMGSCGDDEKEEEAETLPVLVHPLGFRVGPGEDGLYVGAAIGNALVIPAVFAALLRGPLYALLRLRIAGGMGHGAALTAVGWPAALALPFTTLAEGTAAAVVRSARAGRSYSVAAAVVAAAATAVFAASWMRILLLVIRRDAVKLTPNNVGGSGEEEGECQTKEDESGDRSTVRSEGSSQDSVQVRADVAAPDPLHSQATGRPPVAARLLLWATTPTRLWVPVEGRWGPHGRVLSGGKGRGSSLDRVLLRRSVADDSGNDAVPMAVFDGDLTDVLLLPHTQRTILTHDGDRPADTAHVRTRTPPPEGSILAPPHYPSPAAILAAAEESLERYGDSTLGDKRWYWAETVSFGCSVVVGVAEGLPATSAPWCRGRAVLALVASLAQCLCGCAALVPLEALLQAVMAAAVAPMAAAVAAKAFGATGGALDEAIAGLSAAANVVGLALLASTVAMSAFGALLGRPSAEQKPTCIPSPPDIGGSANAGVSNGWRPTFLVAAALRFKASGRRIRRRLLHDADGNGALANRDVDEEALSVLDPAAPQAPTTDDLGSVSEEPQQSVHPDVVEAQGPQAPATTVDPPAPTHLQICTDPSLSSPPLPPPPPPPLPLAASFIPPADARRSGRHCGAADAGGADGMGDCP